MTTPQERNDPDDLDLDSDGRDEEKVKEGRCKLDIEEMRMKWINLEEREGKRSQS
jgi:hypothetical protein